MLASRLGPFRLFRAPDRWRGLRASMMAAVLAAVLSGCWDVASPEHLLIPTLMAIDWSRGQYAVTLQAVVPAQSKMAGGGSSSGQTSSIWVLKGRGSSVMGALYHTGVNVPLRVTLTHLQAVVLGRSTLRPRILSGIVDALVRSPASPHTFYLLATEGSAAQVASAPNPTGFYPAQALIESEDAADSLGTVKAVRFNEWFPHFINAPYQASLLPLVSARVEVPANQGVSYEFPGEVVIVDGAMRGVLDAAQSKLWNLTSAPPRRLAMTHPIMTETVRSTRVSFQVDRHQSNVRWEHGDVVVRDRVYVSLIEQDGGAPGNPPPLGELSGRLSTALSQETLSLVSWSQHHGADLFDVGEAVRAQYPDWMHTHARLWPSVYSQAPLRVHVAVTIEGAGALR